MLCLWEERAPGGNPLTQVRHGARRSVVARTGPCSWPVCDAGGFEGELASDQIWWTSSKGGLPCRPWQTPKQSERDGASRRARRWGLSDESSMRTGGVDTRRSGRFRPATFERPAVWESHRRTGSCQFGPLRDAREGLGRVHGSAPESGPRTSRLGAEPTSCSCAAAKSSSGGGRPVAQGAPSDDVLRRVACDPRFWIRGRRDRRCGSRKAWKGRIDLSQSTYDGFARRGGVLGSAAPVVLSIGLGRRPHSTGVPVNRAGICGGISKTSRHRRFHLERYRHRSRRRCRVCRRHLPVGTRATRHQSERGRDGPRSSGGFSRQPSNRSRP